MEKFKNKYRIETNRMKGYDYGSHGFYFVTICTKNRKNYFGKIIAETHNSASQNESKSTETHNSASQKESKSIETHNSASQNKSKSTETHNSASPQPYLQPTIIGQTAINYWNAIPTHYPFVEMDEFVVMPNHIHGILFFNRPEKTDWQPNQFGAQSQNLGAVIRAFKSALKRYANQNRINFDWQPNYHDNIVRDEDHLNNIRRYIKNNPLKWLNNSFPNQ